MVNWLSSHISKGFSKFPDYDMILLPLYFFKKSMFNCPCKETMRSNSIPAVEVSWKSCRRDSEEGLVMNPLPFSDPQAFGSCCLHVQKEV